MTYADFSRRIPFRDLPRKQQAEAIFFGLASFAFFAYAIADIAGFIQTSNPILAAREAEDPIQRWFWSLFAFLASFITFILAKVALIGTADRRRAALRQFMREMRIIK